MNYIVETILGEPTSPYDEFGMMVIEGESFNMKPRFRHPRGICFDMNGFIIVSENHCISRIRNGFLETVAGNNTRGFVEGNCFSSRFDLPYGICMNRDGEILVCDRHNNRVRKIGKDNIVRTIAGDGTRGFN